MYTIVFLVEPSKCSVSQDHCGCLATQGSVALGSRSSFLGLGKGKRTEYARTRWTPIVIVVGLIFFRAGLQLATRLNTFMGVSVSLEPAPVRADLLTWRLLLQIWGDIVSPSTTVAGVSILIGQQLEVRWKIRAKFLVSLLFVCLQ